MYIKHVYIFCWEGMKGADENVCLKQSRPHSEVESVDSDEGSEKNGHFLIKAGHNTLLKTKKRVKTLE